MTIRRVATRGESAESIRMARCLVTRTLVGPALDVLRERHDVEVWPGPLPPTPEELRTAVADRDGLLCLLTETVDAELLAAALQVVSNYAVGTDNVDLAACRARGIPVGRTPDVLTDATADLAFALVLASVRRLPEAAAAVPASSIPSQRVDSHVRHSPAARRASAWLWTPRGAETICMASSRRPTS
jgi:lactate dehydrogenase-like 2-hydroxyacid dehydrogenase